MNFFRTNLIARYFTKLVEFCESSIPKNFKCYENEELFHYDITVSITKTIFEINKEPNFAIIGSDWGKDVLSGKLGLY